MDAKTPRDTKFVAELAPGAGRVVGICEYKGSIMVACEDGLFCVTLISSLSQEYSVKKIELIEN